MTVGTRAPRGHRAGAGVVVLAAVAALAAGLLVPLGSTALYVVLGVLGGALVVYVLRADLVPPLRTALRASAAALASAGTAGPDAPQTGTTDPQPGGRWTLLAVVTVLGAGVAWVTASQGIRGVLVVVAGVVFGWLLVVVRDRSTVFTFVTVASLIAMLHKSFGPQDMRLASGASAVYVTSFDVLLLVLFALWFFERTMREDLRRAARDPLLWLPLVGGLFLLPSLTAADSVWLALAEVVRMGWMFLLYLYVAVRVRTRKHIGAALGGLLAFVAVEVVVVLLQWRTGGVLGLDFLGVPTTLTDRTTDSTVLGRPFGTITHPVFMAASLGVVALVALALGLAVRRSLLKYAALAAVAGSLAAMWLAHTRASFLAIVAVGVVVVAVALARGWVRWATLGKLALIGLVVAAIFEEPIRKRISENFLTQHFWEEVQSRLELNDIAVAMIRDHPVAGVGLNNFQAVMPAYEQHPVIFFGNPVHNLYLLVLAETGVVGFLGFALIGGTLLAAALHLARSQDPLFGTLGVGIAAAMVFLAVEEMLGFSLRQDVPLALYWLLAGLTVAMLRMSGSRWPDLRRPHHPRRVAGKPPLPRRTTPVRVAAPLLALAVLVGATAVRQATTAVAAPESGEPRLVFTANIRATGQEAIFTAAADGSDVTQITPDDGNVYSWPRWAFGNRRIVFTVRTGAPGAPEAIAIMKPDGTDPQVLAVFGFRVAQPIVDPTGRWLLFTATAPWYPHVALFRMDLRTLESTNITAHGGRVGGYDSDPFVAADGESILFVDTQAAGGAAIADMATDGSNRRLITGGTYFDTDPAVSADGSTVVTASYRGPENPSLGAEGDYSQVKTSDWSVVVQPRSGGPETVLTAGVDCVARTPGDPCTVPEMSGFAPRFIPRQDAVSFVGAIDNVHTVIAALGTDGSDPRVILSSADLAINWVDWSQEGGLPDTTASIGTDVRASQLLVVTERLEGGRSLMAASPDLMHRFDLALPDGLEPLEARWGTGGRILFTAEVAEGTPRAPHPAPPAGQTRREHYTLDDSDPLGLALRQQRLDALPSGLSRRQVFLREPSGAVRQLTDPWIEDWNDGLVAGDARANTDPVMTPDGRAVIVTNTSTLTGETFLLRIDLATGEVVNLTNATAGAQATDDAQAAVSPDGERLAFVWTEGAQRGLHAMDAASGTGVAPLLAGDEDASAPAWSPDGRTVAYVSTREDGTTLVRSARASGDGQEEARTVNVGPTPAWAPVFAPEGDRLLYLGVSGSVAGVYAAPTGDPEAPPAPVQPDPLHHYLDVDVSRP